MKRYLVLLLTFCVAVTAFAGGGSQGAGSAAASGYPNRPVEVLVPGSPGGGADTGMRAVQPTLEKYLGVPVVITNEPAAGGDVCITRTKNARPDGYTWMSWSIASVALRYIVGNLRGAVTTSDFVSVGCYAYDPLVILTQKNGPYKTLDDVMNAARANPGTLIWGRNVPGSTDDLFIIDSEQTHGAKFNVIDGYDTFASAIMGGHVNIMNDSISGALQMHLDGAVEIIGVGGDERVPEIPNVPTFKEQGYDFPVQAVMRYVFGPAGIPAETVKIFSDALRSTVEDQEFQDRAKQLNLRAWYSDPEATTRDVQIAAEAFEAMRN